MYGYLYHYNVFYFDSSMSMSKNGVTYEDGDDFRLSIDP